MKPKNENYISQIIFNGSSKDQKNEKKSIFQDHIESVTIPRDPRLAFWLRRRKRENGSERTFVAPPRPLRFRSLPPYLLPTLYALPVIIGNMMRVLKHPNSTNVMFSKGLGAGLVYLSTLQLPGTNMSTSAFSSLIPLYHQSITFWCLRLPLQVCFFSTNTPTKNIFNTTL